MAEPFTIRRADPSEAALLSELALKSKAHWNYAPTIIEASRNDLTITPEYIENNFVFVLEAGDTVMGFYGLQDLEDGAVELEYMFIAPDAIGGGFGRKLWKHAVTISRQHSYQTIFISSDPYAETFYEAMGARRIGQSENPIRPGEMLPLMQYRL